MKSLIALALTLLSINSFAYDRDTAYSTVCTSLTFESNIKKCVERIAPFSYFDPKALSLCSTLDFDNGKLDCLTAIGNKEYAQYEITTCGNENFDNRKVSCLKNAGQTPNTSCLPKSTVLDHLRSAQQEIRVGQTGSADKRLQFLIAQLSKFNCNL